MAALSKDPVSEPAPRLEYVLSNEDYVAFNLHVAQTHQHHRNELFRYRIIGALVLAAFVAIVAVTMLKVGPAFTLSVSVVAGALWWLLQPHALRRAIRRSLTRIANASALGATGPTRLWLDADGVHEQCAGLTTSALWPVLGRIEESGEHAYIFISPVAAFVVPKRAGTERVNAFLNSVRACQQSMNTSLDSAG